jgi:predicted nucleotide-binding protein (sugar kinase/HSP70/actin superfamily)
MANKDVLKEIVEKLSLLKEENGDVYDLLAVLIDDISEATSNKQIIDALKTLNTIQNELINSLE